MILCSKNYPSPDRAEQAPLPAACHHRDMILSRKNTQRLKRMLRVIGRSLNPRLPHIVSIRDPPRAIYPGERMDTPTVFATLIVL